MVIWLFRDEAKKACLGKPLQEKVLRSVLQSRCQRKVDGTALGVILFGLTENSILMNEIPENTLNVELNRIILVKLQFRENNTLTKYNMENQNLERTLIHLLLSQFIFVFTAYVSFLKKTVLHLQFTTQVQSPTLGLVCPLIGFPIRKLFCQSARRVLEGVA